MSHFFYFSANQTDWCNLQILYIRNFLTSGEMERINVRIIVVVFQSITIVKLLVEVIAQLCYKLGDDFLLLALIY